MSGAPQPVEGNVFGGGVVDDVAARFLRSSQKKERYVRKEERKKERKREREGGGERKGARPIQSEKAKEKRKRKKRELTS